MKFFIDTANIKEILKAKEYGLLDGVTTNPSLMAKENYDWKKIAEQICTQVSGPVSLEVISLDCDEMVDEARELIKFGPNVVVKIPMTLEGIKAIQILHNMDIATNATLIFSPLQALVAMKAGANYISPFVGRLDDLGQSGMELVSQIMTIIDRYAFETEVIVASVRSANHVLEAAMLGADIATIPFKTLEKLSMHPLTDIGLQNFLKDWKKGQNL